MSVILFIAILLILILVHEFGHFIVAKKSGIRVDEFGIGFPPKAKTLWKKNGTEYTLNWIPFGGFVRIFGETPNEESINGPDSDRSFVNKPKYIQIAVIIAGVVFNILFAWILLSGVFLLGTDIALKDKDIPHAENVRLVISHVIADSPAATIGIIPGDTIVSLSSGDNILESLTPLTASEFISLHSDSPLTLSVERMVAENETVTYTVSPKEGLVPDEPERKILGISMGIVGFLQFDNPFKALYRGAEFTYDLTIVVFQGLVAFFGSIATLSANFDEVAGPIGIVGVVGDAAAVGVVSLLFLTALISINLAVINILPIPALDGGRLLFIIIEMIIRKPIKPEIANTIHGIFFLLLIGLILVVSYFDISRLFGG